MQDHEYTRTNYQSDDGTFYQYEGTYGFSPTLQDVNERWNLIALILRDHADQMHFDPEQINSETECRALAAWVDSLVHN